MNSILYFITKTYHAALDLSILAQTQWKSTEDLKEGIGKIAGIIIAISFLVALIAYFVGAGTKTRIRQPARPPLHRMDIRHRRPFCLLDLLHLCRC
ncbi:hypothetical protein OH491_27580 (plasmid) [Termitidicoccus mucosus]|uniref:hypothetical protein n=1 Tax=Termitidicoccus mucosus TaxID=1184151 RepID=UPI003184502A